MFLHLIPIKPTDILCLFFSPHFVWFYFWNIFMVLFLCLQHFGAPWVAENVILYFNWSMKLQHVEKFQVWCWRVISEEWGQYQEVLLTHFLMMEDRSAAAEVSRRIWLRVAVSQQENRNPPPTMTRQSCGNRFVLQPHQCGRSLEVCSLKLTTSFKNWIFIRVLHSVK